jgi:hypothetical protein
MRAKPVAGGAMMNQADVPREDPPVVPYGRASRTRASLIAALTCAGIGALFIVIAAIENMKLQRPLFGLMKEERLYVYAMVALTAIGACVFGWMAMQRDRGHRRLARFAVLLGAVEVIGLGALLLYIATHPYRAHTTIQMCQGHLAYVSLAIERYAIDNDGRLPDTIAELQPSWPAAPLDAPHYIYLGKGLSEPQPHSVVLVYEPLSNHGTGIHVIYGDYKRAWLNRAQAEALIRELEAKQGEGRATTMRTP